MDVIDALKDDHRHIRAVLTRLDTTRMEERQEMFLEVVAKLAWHEAAEAVVVHPVLRRSGDTDDLVNTLVEEEDRAERLMVSMAVMDVESEEFLEGFRLLRRDFLAHAEREEHDEFPRVRDALAHSRRLELADRFTTLRQAAAAQPAVSQSGAMDLDVSAVTGMFSQARDAARRALLDR